MEVDERVDEGRLLRRGSNREREDTGNSPSRDEQASCRHAVFGRRF
jgi:hypothetical protein